MIRERREDRGPGALSQEVMPEQGWQGARGKRQHRGPEAGRARQSEQVAWGGPAGGVWDFVLKV